MDPITAIGAAASIVQLVQTGAQLSIQFYTIGKQIKNAPKIFEEISNEVASTSTILQLLSSELDDQSRLKLHKPAAVQKTKELMAECSAIYEALNQKITPNVKDGASDRAKARAALMKRLKMPYMTDEFSELRNKLMSVKTWLNMMLSTLNLGVQVKGFSGSQEAKDLLLEQRQMLEMLVQETRLLREKTGQSGASGGKVDSTWSGGKDDKGLQNPIMPFVNASTNSLPDSMLTLVDTNTPKKDSHKTSNPSISDHATGQRDINMQVAGDSGRPTMPTPSKNLPEELIFYAKEIHEQARLITDLVDLIDQKSYAISRKTRSSMHEQTLKTHLVQWEKMAQRHGYKYFVSMVEEFPDLLENWSAEMFKDESKLALSDIQVEYNARKGQTLQLPSSGEEKISNASNEQTVLFGRVSKPSDKKEWPRLDSLFLRDGSSLDYTEDVLENEFTPSVDSRRSDTNQPTINNERPSYIRVQERHLLPETLDFYGLPWDYDEEDHRYIIIKRYIDHDMQQELFKHTARIYEMRRLSTVVQGSEKLSKETVTTLKSRATLDLTNDNTFLTRRKDSEIQRSTARRSHWLIGEDSVSSQPASVEKEGRRTSEGEITKKEVRKLSDEEIADLEEVFKLFDKDGTGFLTNSVLGTVYRSLGQNPTTEELEEALKEAKAEDPRKISFKEFLRMMEHQLPGELGEMDETKKCFQVFDKDGRGTISADELRMVMKSLGEGISDEEIDEMVREVDHDDGVVDYEDFTQLLSRRESHVKDAANSSAPPRSHSPGSREKVSNTSLARPAKSAESSVELIMWSGSKDELPSPLLTEEEEVTTPDVSKDVENLLREYTLLDEDELSMLRT